MIITGEIGWSWRLAKKEAGKHWEQGWKMGSRKIASPSYHRELVPGLASVLHRGGW
jgi:hypothetical protein